MIPVKTDFTVSAENQLLLHKDYWSYAFLIENILYPPPVQLNVSALDPDIMELQKNPKTNFTNIEIHQDRSAAKDSAI